MSLDLGSSVLDVAFGLSFIFFLLSVVSSALSEGVAWATKQRSKMLEKGLKGMLGKPTEHGDVANKVWEHPMVQSDVTSPSGKKNPSYVSPRNFALALTETLKEVETGGREGVKYGREAVEQIESSFEKLDPKLKEQLKPLWFEVEKDIDKFRGAVERWFDDAMDRVSGWYKRWSQWITLAIAILVAIGLNASALRITETLYSDESVRSAVVASAEKAAGDSGAEAGKETPTGAVEELEALPLPIFWAEENLPWNSLQAAGESILGWLITAIAISFGAPFWFDALGKISRLRTAGAKPAEAGGGEPSPVTVNVTPPPTPQPAPPGG